MPEEITWFEIITVIALIAGPVTAVIIARNMDARRAKRERRMDIFRTMMRTRRTPIMPDHVGALNLVEIEFKDEPAVITEWKAYFAHLGTDHPKRTEEQVKDDMKQEEKNQRLDRYDQRIAKEREKLLAKLLHAIAKVLDFKIEQLEIFEGGYVPQGWNTIEMQQEAIRRFMVGLYLGHTTLPISVLDYTKPPPGELDKKKGDDAAPKNGK